MSMSSGQQTYQRYDLLGKFPQKIKETSQLGSFLTVLVLGLGWLANIPKLLADAER